MHRKWLALAVGLAVGATTSLGAAQEPRKLTVWNDSDQDIIVVVETPAQNDASRRTVEVPARTTVFNIPIPSVDGDQIATAFEAQPAAQGLKRAIPARLVGFSKLFFRHRSPGVNSTIPVLQFRAYQPRNAEQGGYGGYGASTLPPHEIQEEVRAVTRSLSVPVYTDEAQQMVGKAMQNPNRIDYDKVKKQAP